MMEHGRRRMEDGDRPGGRDGGGRSQPATPLRVYRGGRSQRPTAGRPESPEGVAERLTALERVVEDALARGGPAERDRTLVASSFDELLAAVALVRRGSLGEIAAALGLAPDDPSLVAEMLLRGLARWWWRVETRGIDRLPAEGPVVVIANRASAPLPFDALIVARALRDAHPARRRVHVVLADDGPRLPGVGALLARLGVARTRSAAAQKLLARGEAVLLFPEDDAAVAGRPFADRYRLARFGGAFARLAIDAGAPIVPVAVVGAAETQPVLVRLPLGLPVTPTFPWLGVPGLLGLPTKWTLDLGEPLVAEPTKDPATRRRAVAELRTGARERLQALVLDALRGRESILLG
jgi:1-acyl-sn-glycerol-3-phosphate acyltransferase